MFYDKDGRILNLDVNFDEIVGNGYFSEVYKINRDTCYKVIKYKFRKDYQDKKEVLEFLQELELDNIYKIKEFIYDEDKSFCGYIMEYIKRESIDLINSDKQIFINIYLKLLRLVRELSESGIRLQDFRNANTIINNNGVNIIDADFYYFDEPEECFKENFDLFKKYIIELLVIQLASYDIDNNLLEVFTDINGISKHKIEELLDQEIDLDNLLGFIDKFDEVNSLREYFNKKMVK